MRLVIIGGGTAAVEAAVAARNADPEASITVLSREHTLPYRRPALSRMVTDDLPDNQFLLKSAAFYAERKIDLRISAAVVAVDRENRTVTLADGTREPYDRLLFATGADCRMLPLPGADQTGVFGYRSYADVLALRAHLQSGARSVAIIGGGLLGLELADSLIAASCRVTILEGMDRMLPRQLDEEGSRVFEAALSRIAGLTVLTGAAAARIAGEGRVAGVELSDGRSFECDTVVMAPGTVPAVVLAQDCGLAVERGIKVDVSLRTADPAVFAAGDCAEVEGIGVSGLAAPAAAAGKIAGVNMTGGALTYTATPAAARLNALGVKLFSVGKLAAPEILTAADPASGVWKRLFLAGNVPAGGILLGDLKSALRWQSEITAGKAASPETLAEFGR